MTLSAALSTIALVLGIGLAVLGGVGGAVAAAAIDDRAVQKAGIAVAAGGFALFIALVSLLPALVSA